MHLEYMEVKLLIMNSLSHVYNNNDDNNNKRATSFFYS